jgi:hypothetical protein
MVKVILVRFKEHYGDDVISPCAVYYRVKQIRLGRKERSFQTFQHPDEAVMMRLLMPSPTDLQRIPTSQRKELLRRWVLREVQ